jgi:ubiquinone/menaquinone biosynthesis C-methylase UbiE
MRSTEEWRRRAREDPWFAVASHDGKQGTWDPEDFYELGRADWEDFRPRWEHYAGSLGESVLEIGCGAGRITKQLADTFATVVALDVSEDMLKLTGQAVPEAHLELVNDVQIPLDSAAVDSVFTCHVWQHYEDPDEVATQIRECFRVLRPRGTLMAHLILTDDDPLRVPRDAARAARRQIDKRLHPERSQTRVRQYSSARVREMLESSGFADVELQDFRVRSNGGVHPFWFARRPPGSDPATAGDAVAPRPSPPV